MVFSFFKKPPPERMVAKPAAASPRPAAGDASPPAAPDGLTTPSGFSVLSEGAGAIHVQAEGDIDPVESDVEQAAVLYANAQDEAARVLLEQAVRVHCQGPGERLWLMLFDLYRLSGQRAPFDALSLEYARAFEKSPPAWSGGGQTAPAKAAAVPPAGAVPFNGELTGDNAAAFAALEQAVDRSPKLRIALGKVKAVDDPGAERLLSVLARARKQGGEIDLDGRDALAALLESRIAAGRREAPGCWLLLLELYQSMGRHAAFEETAIDYAVTFEVSPPSWEPQRAAGPAPAPAGGAAAGDDALPAYAPKGELKAERFADLPGFAERQEALVLDFSAVTRIDFVSAGTLVNLLTTIGRQGKRIVVRHPNRLVAELLGVIGLHPVAEIEFARN